MPLAPLAVALLLSLLPAARARAEAQPASPVRLLEGWRYRWGDSPLDAQGVPVWARESGEGEGWRPAPTLDVPEGRDGQRFLWLSIPVAQGPWEEPGLLLGAVANAFEVYADGRRLFASGTLSADGREEAEHNGWVLVHLPREALGRRVLLRIQSSSPGMGIRRDVRVGEHDALYRHEVGAGVTGFVLGILLLVVGAGAALAFARWRTQKALPHLATFAAGSGLLLMGLSGVPRALWGNGHTWYLLHHLGTFFAVPGLFGFIASTLFSGRRSWMHRGVVPLYAAAGLVTLGALTLEGGVARVVTPYLALTLAVLVSCFWVLVAQARQGNVEARIVSAGAAGLLLAALVTALPNFGLFEALGQPMHWGLLALTLSLLALLARRAVRLVRTLESHTQTLEAQHGRVQQLAQRMGSGSVELLSAVGQLRAASSVQNEGVERQAAALQEAQTTVAEIRQTSALTAEKAMLLAAATSEADDAGREGLAALERTLAGLEGIRQEVSGMAQRIHALEARTREIAGIVETVKGLADQSNMLALNAAIEAVRSGEHGKGFGVVAREVRSLADQSIQATERIREILDGVGTSMREASGASARGEERVRQSVEELQVSGEQLRRLAVIVGETGQSVRQMTAAVSQQDAGTSQIAAAITDLSEQMQRTLQALQETEAVTRSVEQLAASMSESAAAAQSGALSAAAARR